MLKQQVPHMEKVRVDGRIYKTQDYDTEDHCSFPVSNRTFQKETQELVCTSLQTKNAVG